MDAKNPQFSGYFINWTLTLWGEMADGFEGTPIHIPVSAPQEEQTPEEAMLDETEEPLPPPSDLAQETPLAELTGSLDGQTVTPSSPASDSKPQDEKSSAETESKTPSFAWPIEEHQDDHRSFFARVVAVLLVLVGAVGCVYLVKRYTQRRSRGYTGVPNQDENQYEFDVIQHDSPQQHKRPQRGRPE